MCCTYRSAECGRWLTLVNLDRLLLLITASKGRLLAMVPRLAISTFLGFLIAEPLTYGSSSPKSARKRRFIAGGAPFLRIGQPTVAAPGVWEEVGRLNTPLDPEPAKAPTPGDPAEALEKRTRRFLGITIAVAGIVALTHQSLTAALASAHRDSALKAAHAMLTWPLPMTQPILAGVAAFVLLGIAVQTNGWRQVTARQSRLLLGFVIAAILGSGPMVLFCVLTVILFSLVISLVLVILLILLLLLIVAR